MGLISRIAEVYRDSEVMGVPASGAHDPRKAAIRGLMAEVVGAIANGGEELPADIAADLAAVAANLEAAPGLASLVSAIERVENEVAPQSGVILYEGGVFTGAPRSDFKGDPGGNEESVGPFAAIQGMNIGPGVASLRVTDRAQAILIEVQSDVSLPSAGQNYWWTTSNGGSRRWRLAAAENRVSIVSCGAVGDGQLEAETGTDNTAAVRAAVEMCHWLGGGTVVVPDAREAKCFITRDFIYLRRFVSVHLVGKNSVLANVNSNFNSSFVFTPGNFHPEFTAAAVRYAVAPFTPNSRTVSLVVPDHAARFAAGDQIMLTSQATRSAGGFTIPEHLILNEVTGTSGAAVTLKYPVDMPGVDASIVRLVDNPSRYGEPLYFWQESGIYGLGELISKYGAIWSDSAALGCSVRDVRSLGRRSVAYGNTWQRSTFSGFTSRFYQLGTEFSHNCYDVTVGGGARYIYVPRSGETTTFAASVQECGRKVIFDSTGCVFELGDFPAVANEDLFKMSAAQDCVMGGRVSIGTRGGSSAPCLSLQGGGSTATFPHRNNFFRGLELKGASVGRHARINGGGSGHFYDVGIENCTIDAAASISDSLLVEGCQGRVDIKRSRFTSGTLKLTDAGNTGRFQIEDIYVEGGLDNAANIVDDVYRQHHIRNLRYAGTTTKRAFRTRNIAGVYVGPGLSVNVFTGSLAAALVTRDIVHLKVRAQLGGNNAIRTFTLVLRNNTDSADIINLPMVFAGSATGWVEIDIELAVIGSNYVYTAHTLHTVEGVKGHVGQAARSPSKDITMRLDAMSAGGNADINVRSIDAWVDSPLYDYAS